MERRFSLAVFILLAAVSMAGCLGGGQEVVDNGPPAYDAGPGALGNQFEPLPDDGESDWYFMETLSQPEGGATGFKWVFPKDAPINDGDDLVLEMVPILPEGNESGLQSWGVLFFSKAVLGADFVDEFQVGPWNETITAIGGGGTSNQTESKLADWISPKAVTVDARLFTSDRVYMVLHAETAAHDRFGIAFRILGEEEAPANPADTPSQDLADFMAAVDSDYPVAIERLGTGTGAYREEYHYTAVEGAVTESKTAEISVIRSLPSGSAAAEAAQEWIIWAMDSSRVGWTHGYLQVYHATGSGSWDASAQLRDNNRSGGGQIPPAGNAQERTGFEMLSEGVGNSTLQVQLSMAGADTVRKEIHVVMTGLGTPLTQLLGMKAVEDSDWFTEQDFTASFDDPYHEV